MLCKAWPTFLMVTSQTKWTLLYVYMTIYLYALKLQSSANIGVNESDDLKRFYHQGN